MNSDLFRLDLQEGSFAVLYLLSRILKRYEAGQKAADLAREVGVSEATIYTWKAKYGGLEVSEAQRLRQLEEENRRLKHLVADLSLDKEVLNAVISKKRMELAAQPQDVGFAVTTFPISERRACELLGAWRSSCRYKAKPDDDSELRTQLMEPRPCRLTYYGAVRANLRSLCWREHGFFCAILSGHPGRVICDMFSLSTPELATAQGARWRNLPA